MGNEWTMTQRDDALLESAENGDLTVKTGQVLVSLLGPFALLDGELETRATFGPVCSCSPLTASDLLSLPDS